MRILHISSGLGRGGRERQLYELLRALRSECDICLLVLSNDIMYSFRELGLPLISVAKQQRYKPAVHLSLLKQIREFRPDIIHYWDYPSKILAFEAKFLLKSLLVDGSIRFVDEAPCNPLVRFMKSVSFKFADHIVANSMAGLEIKGFKNKKKASVIHNGIDLARFKPDPMFVLESDQLSNDYIRIIMVAGFQPAKDHRTLLLAANVLCAEMESLQFLMVGDGLLRSSAEALVDPSFRQRMLFLGLRTDIEQILLRCDIGVLLSTSTEGLSNAIMEYMAAGLPVLATKQGGTRELVQDGVSGYLIDNHDVGQVIDKLRLLIQSPELRKQMGESGCRRVREHFSLDKMVSGYMELYMRLMAGKRGR